MGICYRFLRRWVSAGSAGWAVALGVFASPLLLYAFHEGAYSHALGFFLGSAVVAVWWKRYQATTKADGTPPVFPSGALGLVCGLAILVRWQSGIYLLFP
jgi:4-amino-4-deoxy-L-arabinose transferase-like glycosyltransferase